MIDSINKPIRMFDAITSNVLGNIITFCIIDNRKLTCMWSHANISMQIFNIASKRCGFALFCTIAVRRSCLRVCDVICEQYAPGGCKISFVIFSTRFHDVFCALQHKVCGKIRNWDFLIDGVMLFFNMRIQDFKNLENLPKTLNYSVYLCYFEGSS